MDIIHKVVKYFDRKQKLSVVTPTDISPEKRQQQIREKDMKKAKEMAESMSNNQFCPNF
jgi:hypothetical protein